MRSVRSVSGRLYKIRFEENTKRTEEGLMTRLFNVLGYITVGIVYICQIVVWFGVIVLGGRLLR